METTGPTSATPPIDQPRTPGRESSRRPRSHRATTAVVAGTVAVAGVAAAVSATAVLALGQIPSNHNETLVRS